MKLYKYHLHLKFNGGKWDWLKGINGKISIFLDNKMRKKSIEWWMRNGDSAMIFLRLEIPFVKFNWDEQIHNVYAGGQSIVE